MDIKKVLKEHRDWLLGNGGQRADLRGADLSELDLSGADLSGADLSGSDLSYANMRESDLSESDLRGADMYRANLRGANLSESDLRGSDLSYANLCESDLSESDLSGANMYGADMYRANLSRANLRGSDLRESDLRGADLYMPIACPEEGAFIAFKKAYDKCCPYIVKLEICKDALRSSATTRKCRCSKAKVLDITTIEGKSVDKVVHSLHDPYFLYEKGEIIEVQNFDKDRWDECSTGIHFFITRQEAVNY